MSLGKEDLEQLRSLLSATKWTFYTIMNGEAGPVTPEQREFLERGHESAEKAITIINKKEV